MDIYSQGRHHFRWIATPRRASFTGILCSAVSLSQNRELRLAFAKMCVISQRYMPIEHEQIMYECTDGFEDCHTHTNVSVWISPGVSTLTSASGHVLCCYASSTLVPAASMALIILRVPGPGASKICWHRRKLWSSLLHGLGRLLGASTYVASCA
jgi:hypothetical protein